MKKSTWLLGLLLITACATSSGPDAADPGTRVIHRNAVIHEGPELVAAVAHPQGERSLGEEYLILAVEFSSAQKGGPIVVSRNDITLRTPDGRRLALVSQKEFRKNFPRLRIPIERTLDYLPLLERYQTSQMPCDRWFLADPFGEIAFDEIPVSTFQMCSGPMVFRIPGGVQPGRWRLVIELEESTADIPFELGVDR